MTKPLTYACTTLLFVACGGRELEADTDPGTGSSSTSDDSDSVSITESNSLSLSSTISDPTTETTDDPSTTSAEVTSDDPDSTGTPETTGGPSDGNCCEAHAEPGCEEDAVATCVCKAAPECCVFEWAPNCAELAVDECAATCMGPDDTSGGESTGGPVGGDCDEVVEIELQAGDAVLEGGWTLIDSQSKEGLQVAQLDQQNPMGTVTWDVDVPCNDEFHIWVRAYDFGSDDTFFATLDGGPDPAPIFEAGCTMGGNGYVWTELNWRDPENGMACEYVEDPWLAEWDAGTHQVQFAARDSPALSRIIVTNDDAFLPE